MNEHYDTTALHETAGESVKEMKDLRLISMRLFINYESYMFYALRLEIHQIQVLLKENLLNYLLTYLLTYENDNKNMEINYYSGNKSIFFFSFFLKQIGNKR